ncbi:MAG: hypothetical protein IJM81_08725 [Prevotella sp.]|nr:hypothetical protein [Prevotella sp.]
MEKKMYVIPTIEVFYINLEALLYEESTGGEGESGQVIFDAKGVFDDEDDGFTFDDEE